ncbi:MAG: aminopeptidase P N-terminal domain-containing protein [Gemmatimonadetes bacterium]|nr:aminopeptidase P N-terminal domain-containing protein [Gemmatimonadota bacterium]
MRRSFPTLVARHVTLSFRVAGAGTLLLLGLAASPLPAQIAQSEFAARRAALAAALPDGVILVLGAGEPNPDFIPFNQHPQFRYLTGFDEPGSALVIVKAGESRRELLFVRPRDPAAEVWNGARLGVDGVRSSLGMEGRNAAVLRTVLDSLLAQQKTLHVLGDLGARMTERSAHDQFVDAVAQANPGVTVDSRAATRAMSLLRGRKSTAELERIRISSEISARGHVAAMRLVQPGIAEFELQAAAEGVWRREGADGPSYGSIVGSGPNSTTLHYNRNDRTALAGELIVMDMAAYFDGYAADITRTVPVSGRFTTEQRAIYQIVLDAHKAAERQIRVDGVARAMTDSANAVLAAGLTAVGLIESPTATYDCGSAEQPRNCAQLGLYYMHGLGHGIGLLVHDPDQYSATGKFAVGSAFTIEPGIYVRGNLLDIIADTPRNREVKARIGAAVARHANIGVRIEDDYLVTGSGVIRPSAGAPREIADIERLLAEPRTARDPAVVERYRRFKTGR